MKLRIQSVRVRVTFGASLVALVALSIAAVLLVGTLRRSQLDTIDRGLELRAVDIESLLDGGATPASVAVESEDASFVQILRPDGTVIASSSNIDGEPAITSTAGEGRSTRSIPALGDDEFRVYTRPTDGSQRVTIAVGTSLEELEHTQNSLVASLVVGVPALLVLLAGLTWIVAGRALRPVDGIRRRVDEIGAGQLDQRVPVPATRDEVGRLATTMNQMLDRLEDAHQRQARFVSDASHELRTPIAVIRHELEVALATDDTEHWRDTARDVLDEDLRMQRLVDDLLFIARHEHGPTAAPADIELVDLDDLVVAEARRQRRKIPIDLSGVSAGQVRGDPDHLARVVSNLLDNAVRHATSQVAAHVTTADGVVTIDIDDDGPGIPEAQREAVFERFTRTDESRTRDDGGTGLGLAIARDIINAHHGTISAHASPWLRGARITVVLPDARA
jgi:signal transduction histidine kinase